MKEKYIEPEIGIVEFDNEDVITTSDPTLNPKTETELV